jgi:hypothetical protein
VNVNLSPPAFYAIGPEGECPHSGAQLTCDLNVSTRWYVACSACGAAGPTAESTAEALAGWAELVEFVEVLAIWNAAQAGDAGAAFVVDQAVGRQCDHPCREYFELGACACTAMVQQHAAEALAEALT